MIEAASFFLFPLSFPVFSPRMNDPRYDTLAKNLVGFSTALKRGETVLLELERRGVVSSSGSACAAGSDEASHVLLALGVDPDAVSNVIISHMHYDRYHPAPQKNAPIAIILHPHPQFGGTMHTKGIYHTAKGLARTGCAVLRFNFRGIGKSEGATLHWGGELLNRETPGFYMQPALFTNVINTMRVAREEIFGPVGVVIRAKNYDDALAISNDTEFGLSAGICTSSLKYATHFKRNSEAGMVMVNLPTAGVDYHVPFGGRKGSSYGPREQGAYAKEFYTTVKTAYTFAG